MVDYFLSKGADEIKRGFTSSCASNNKELIIFFLNEARQFIPTDYGFNGI